MTESEKAEVERLRGLLERAAWILAREHQCGAESGCEAAALLVEIRAAVPKTQNWLAGPSTRWMYRLVVPWDPNTLSHNRSSGRHIGTKAKLARDAKYAGSYAWHNAGDPVARGKVRVFIHVRRLRKMDSDNIIGGLKAVFDGIFKGNMTPDDSPRWVEIGEVTQETGEQFRGRPETVLLVEELET